MIATALLTRVVRAKGSAEHVVIVVFDGLRPDFITPQYCPNLYSLATNGVFFEDTTLPSLVPRLSMEQRSLLGPTPGTAASLPTVITDRN